MAKLKREGKLSAELLARAYVMNGRKGGLASAGKTSKEKRAAAIENGRKGGRPPKISTRNIKTIRALLESANTPVTQIAARFHIAPSTIYRFFGKPGACL